MKTDSKFNVYLTIDEITLIIRATERTGDLFDENSQKANDYYNLADKFINIRTNIRIFYQTQEVKYKIVKEYGYDYNGMFFFTSDEAKRLFYKYTIYKCYPDGTEAEVLSREEIEDGFYYGIEKDDYLIEV